MDETGFSIGEKEATRCIINAQIRQQFQAKPGRQEWVSVVECICADGSVIAPLVIFRAKNLSREWIPANTYGYWRFAYNSKGWTSNEHGMYWLTRCFEPETRDKAAGEYRLLIYDGHDSHITGPFIAHCIDHKIILFILPPHSSHMTQPLDVAVFGPLKKHMAAEIDTLISTGIISRVMKVEWLTAYVVAHNKVFSARNILSAFRGAGIHPFLPTKVLDRLANSLPPQTQTPPPTPLNPTVPFNDATLTMSPFNFNAVQQATTALNTMLDSGDLIRTLAKNFVRFLARSVVCFHTRSVVLEHENVSIKAVENQRKRPLSGKRKVVDGKHVMTAAELLGVEEAEKVIKERKAKKGTGAP